MLCKVPCKVRKSSQGMTRGIHVHYAYIYIYTSTYIYIHVYIYIQTYNGEAVTSQYTLHIAGTKAFVPPPAPVLKDSLYKLGSRLLICSPLVRTPQNLCMNPIIRSFDHGSGTSNFWSCSVPLMLDVALLQKPCDPDFALIPMAGAAGERRKDRANYQTMRKNNKKRTQLQEMN